MYIRSAWELEERDNKNASITEMKWLTIDIDGRIAWIDGWEILQLSMWNVENGASGKDSSKDDES